ncbi:MAG TPA: hypothetical protein VFQ85_08520, partial [Mycobacteriales bacterium]|nr:hypothetical protein [Mycobacteriales bacterium]
ATLLTPPAAHADIELDVLRCEGTLPPAVLHPGYFVADGSMTCTAGRIGVETLEAPHPWYSGPVTIAVENDPVSDGVVESHGLMSFVRAGATWYVRFEERRLTVDGRMPFGTGPTDFDDRVQVAGDPLPHHIRAGSIRDRCTVAFRPPFVNDGPCLQPYDFDFVAEVLHDLPV